MSGTPSIISQICGHHTYFGLFLGFWPGLVRHCKGHYSRNCRKRQEEPGKIRRTTYKKAHGHYSTKGATLDAVNVFPPGYGTACPVRLRLGRSPRRERSRMGSAVTRALPAKPQGGLVHTAGGMMGVASTRSRIANPQGKRPPTISPMTGSKFRHDSTELAEVRRTNSTRRAWPARQPAVAIAALARRQPAVERLAKYPAGLSLHENPAHCHLTSLRPQVAGLKA